MSSVIAFQIDAERIAFRPADRQGGFAESPVLNSRAGNQTIASADELQERQDPRRACFPELRGIACRSAVKLRGLP